MYSTENRELSRLDSKLKQALGNQLKGDVGTFVDNKEEEYQLAYSKPLKGRQVLWLIYKYFAVSETTEKTLTFAHLLSVVWTKDSEMKEFLTTWKKDN